MNASTPATIQTLKVYGSSGITFTNLTFDLTGVPMDPSTGWYTTAFQVTLSSNLTFTNLIVHGNLNGTLATDISGFLIRQSSNINVTHSDFSHMHYAIDQIENNGMLIQANNFHDLRDDGVRGGGTSNIVVDSNHCYSNHPDGPADTDHPDCIQFWTQGVTHPVSNITVTNNRYDVGTGFPTQFIFFGNETNQLFNNVTIRGNTAFGSLWRAVSVTYAANVTIQNNNLTGPCIVYPGVGQIITPWVSTKNVNGATVSGNTADLVFSEGGDTNVAYSGNTLVGCVH